MKRFLTAALCLFVCTLALQAAKHRVKYGPWVPVVAETSFTVNWVTEVPTQAWVEVAPDDGTNFYKMERPRFYETLGGRTVTRTSHSVTVTGLKPGTRYRYKVCGRELIDGTNSYSVVFGQPACSYTPTTVKTLDASAPTCKFTVVNDIHARDAVYKQLLAGKKGTDMAAQGEGLYWKYESTLKRWDSELYSAMGAAGELYAMDATMVRNVPDEALLDDFMMSMYVVDDGKRIAYTSEAYAQEYGSANIFEESKRKRRIAAGGLQSIWWLRSLLNPFKQPIVTFQYVSHRVLRWSVTPVAMVILFIVNVILTLMGAGRFYSIVLILQTLFYLMAFIGWLTSRYGHRNKLLYTIYYFVFMNINVFRGMVYLRTHGKSGAWEKAKRS